MIAAINAEGYSGGMGNPIRITATDDTKVTGVGVRIFNASGLVEEGEAQQQTDTDDWIYLATASNGSLPGSRIVVEARDLPGNNTTEEIVL